MKKLLTLLTLSLFALGLSAQETGCHFVQNSTRKGVTVFHDGILFFAEPDLLRLNYLHPKGDYLIVDETMLRSRFNGQASDIDTEKDFRARAFRNALVYGYTGKYEELANEMNADVSVKEEKGVKTVTLTPKSPISRGISVVEASYDAKGRATRLVITRSGDRRLASSTPVTEEYLFDY